MSAVLEHPLNDRCDLNFEQTVSRSLVHKRSLDNVLLTEVRGPGNDHFLCAGRIPTAHRFFNAGRTPQKDILFYTELGRQASLAVSHMFLGVSRDDVFIFEQSQAWMKEAAWSAGDQPDTASVITDIRVHAIERRKNNAVSLVVADHVMSIGGEEVFQAIGGWTVQPAALFHRPVGMAKPESSPVVAEISTGTRRILGSNVVIFVPRSNEDRTEFATSLIVDKTHPYFFDHPWDRVPEMLLLEGCSQLAQAAVSHATSVPRRHLAISGYEVSFQQFVECDTPVVITAELDPTETSENGWRSSSVVHISISQQNALCGTATLNVASLI